MRSLKIRPENLLVTSVAGKLNPVQFLRSRAGLTLIELIVTAVILGILGSIALPLSHMATVRGKELELRQSLRSVRTALDAFKKDYDQAVVDKKIIAATNNTGYPESLQQLVDGYDFGGLYAYKKKYLRRIPPDPMNPPEKDEPPRWGLRSYNDAQDSGSWGGEDIYDIYSLSTGTALDGSSYKDW